MKAQTLILTLALIALAACAKTQKTADSADSEVQGSVEAGITSISGTADDQSGGGFAYNDGHNLKSYAYALQSMMLPEANAAACSGRAYQDPCNAGVKQEVYNNCELPFAGMTLNGQVSLTYSDPSCSMATTGDTVTRTYDVDIAGLLGGVLSISSSQFTDYNGNTYGGGGRITKTNPGWDLEILGKHKQYDRGGKERLNVSIRTTSPIAITGSLSRNGRVANGGAYEVNHNRAGFTATYVPNNVTWSNLCCHPVSGSLSVTYTGKITGTGTVTFNGCGQATLNKDGLSQQVSLNYCE